MIGIMVYFNGAILWRDSWTKRVVGFKYVSEELLKYCPLLSIQRDHLKYAKSQDPVLQDYFGDCVVSLTSMSVSHGEKLSEIQPNI